MGETTVRIGTKVTSRRANVEQVIYRLQEIGNFLVVRHPQEKELINKYLSTIETFSVPKLRNNPAELMRITAMLNSLMRDIKDDFEITDRIRTLRQLIKVAEREFEIKE
jgi:hypothetical protein